MRASAGLRPEHLLRDVSRSFYLSLRVLPASIREQIGLAYLLARAADTVADAPHAPAEGRLAALRAIQSAIDGGSAAAVRGPGGIEAARSTESGGGSTAEMRLLEALPALLERLAQLDAADGLRIRTVLAHITRGQEDDILRFHPPGLSAMETDEDLETYVYRVAGCVGEFWDAMCGAHLWPKAIFDRGLHRQNAVRFGKGLQLVNILRDLPADLRQGRCYIPSRRLREIGLHPADLLDRGSMERFRPLYESFLDRAEANLAAGWDYTLAVPFTRMRVRLACAWPLLIGARTLVLLRNANALEGAERVRVSRSELRAWMLRSLWCYPLPRVWAGLFDRARARPARGAQVTPG